MVWSDRLRVVVSIHGPVTRAFPGLDSLGVAIATRRA
jgi:hypothetical protein